MAPVFTGTLILLATTASAVAAPALAPSSSARSPLLQLRCADANQNVSERFEPSSDGKNIMSVRVQLNARREPAQVSILLKPRDRKLWRHLMTVNLAKVEDTATYEIARWTANLSTLLEREFCEGSDENREKLLSLMRENRVRNGLKADLLEEDDRLRLGDPDDNKVFRPVGVFCPAEHRGIYEETYKNQNGDWRRLRVKFDPAGHPALVTLGRSTSTGEFDEYLRTDQLGARTISGIAASTYVEDMQPRYQNLCLNPGPRTADYRATLEANLRDLNN